MLTRDQIRARVPHGGAMCLLESVGSWDATTIVCHADGPTADHPLRNALGVPAVAAIEYAAQAAALHGALLDTRDTPRAGMLAKVSEVELIAACIDGPEGRLMVRAELLGQVASGCLYAFEVTDQRATIARGRLLVAFSP